MIITNCTYCEEVIMYPYEAGDEPVGAFDKQECEACGKNNFIQRISFDGVTLLEEDFWEQYPEAKSINNN